MTSVDFPLHRPELLGVLANGDKTLRDAMKPPAARRKSEVLLRTGEAGKAVYRVESGWVARSRQLEDGRRQLIGVLLPGDLVAVEAVLFARQPDTIECLTEAAVQAIDHQSLRALMTTDAAVAIRVMFHLAEEQRRHQNWIAALGRGHADERIATLLLDLHGRLHRAGLADAECFELRMTQQEIADHLGLTLVHVNRVLRRLRDANLITVNKGSLKIENLAALSRLAAPLQDIFERSRPEFGGGSRREIPEQRQEAARP
jgi:CRP-like cAMP-binding protein